MQANPGGTTLPPPNTTPSPSPLPECNFDTDTPTCGWEVNLMFSSSKSKMALSSKRDMITAKLNQIISQTCSNIYAASFYYNQIQSLERKRCQPNISEQFDKYISNINQIYQIHSLDGWSWSVENSANLTEGGHQAPPDHQANFLYIEVRSSSLLTPTGALK